MSHMVGADVDELRQLASTFNARAAQLKSIESQLNWRIHSAPWEGHDVSRFVNDWNTRHRRVIASAAVSITNAAQDLLANADQQEQASTAGYAGGIASVAALRAREAARVGSADKGSSTSGWSLLAVAGTALATISRVNEYFSPASDIYLIGSVLRQTEGIKNLRSFAFAEEFVVDSSRTLSVLEKIGMWAGPIGVVSDGFQFCHDYHDGNKPDLTGMALSGTSAVVGTALFAGQMAVTFGVGAAIAPALPALAAAGLVLGVAGLVYENRESIAAFGKATLKAAGAAAEWTTSRAIDVGRATLDLADRTADSARQAVDSTMNSGKKFVDSILKKPSWAPW